MRETLGNPGPFSRGSAGRTTTATWVLLVALLVGCSVDAHGPTRAAIEDNLPTYIGSIEIWYDVPSDNPPPGTRVCIDWGAPPLDNEDLTRLDSLKTTTPSSAEIVIFGSWELATHIHIIGPDYDMSGARILSATSVSYLRMLDIQLPSGRMLEMEGRDPECYAFAPDPPAEGILVIEIRKLDGDVLRYETPLPTMESH